jgi:hypothetical protein
MPHIEVTNRCLFDLRSFASHLPIHFIIDHNVLCFHLRHRLDLLVHLSKIVYVDDGLLLTPSDEYFPGSQKSCAHFQQIDLHFIHKHRCCVVPPLAIAIIHTIFHELIHLHDDGFPIKLIHDLNADDDEFLLNELVIILLLLLDDDDLEFLPQILACHNDLPDFPTILVDDDDRGFPLQHYGLHDDFHEVCFPLINDYYDDHDCCCCQFHYDCWLMYHS